MIYEFTLPVKNRLNSLFFWVFNLFTKALPFAIKG